MFDCTEKTHAKTVTQITIVAFIYIVDSCVACVFLFCSIPLSIINVERAAVAANLTTLMLPEKKKQNTLLYSIVFGSFATQAFTVGEVIFNLLFRRRRRRRAAHNRQEQNFIVETFLISILSMPKYPSNILYTTRHIS